MCSSVFWYFHVPISVCSGIFLCISVITWCISSNHIRPKTNVLFLISRPTVKKICQLNCNFFFAHEENVCYINLSNSNGMDMWNAPMVQSRQPLTYRLMESVGLGGPRWHGNSWQRGIAESGSSWPSTLMIDIPGDLVWDLPCMQQASYLEGGPLVWMLPLYLHVNQKSDYDDDTNFRSSLLVYLFPIRLHPYKPNLANLCSLFWSMQSHLDLK